MISLCNLSKGLVFTALFAVLLPRLARVARLCEYQIEKIEAHECLYSSKASLTSALTTHAKRAAMWKRLVPSGH